MRVLLSSMGQKHWIDAFASVAEVRTAEEIRTPGEFHVTYDLAEDTAQRVLARLPKGWVPDVWVFTSPEYSAMPDGMESVPCPTVGLFGDRNLCTLLGVHLAPFFDIILAAEPCMIQTLRGAGAADVRTFNHYAADDSLYKKLPNTARDTDVTFVGSLNPLSYRARAKSLEVLNSLSDRFKIRIETNQHGSPVNQLYNRSKLIFNRSGSNGVNTRVFEAGAAGIALLCEDSNEQIRDYFKDGESVILYNDANLAAKIAQYREDGPARERIADTAKMIVMENHTAEKRAAQILEIVTPLPADAAGKRTATGLDPEVLAHHRMRAHMLLGHPYAAAQTSRRAGNNHLGDLAVLDVWMGREEAGMARIRKLEDAGGIALVNLAQLLTQSGQWSEARPATLAAISRLEAATNWDDLGDSLLIDARTVSRMRMRWERVIEARCAAGDEVTFASARNALLAHVMEMKGDIESVGGPSPEARAAYTTAFKLAGQDGEIAFKLGRWLAQTGAPAEAAKVLFAAVDFQPFYGEAQVLLAQTLVDAGQGEAARVAAEAALKRNPLLSPTDKGLLQTAQSPRAVAQARFRGQQAQAGDVGRKLRILTFLWDEPYMALLAATGHEFDCVATRPDAPPIRTGWTLALRPQPANVRIIDKPAPVVASGGRGYDLVLGQTIYDLQVLARMEIPKLLMSRRALLTETGLITPEARNALRAQVSTALGTIPMVFASEGKRKDWGLPAQNASWVIRLAVNPEELGGWTGEIPRVLRVGNYLIEHDCMLGYSVQEKILAGRIPSSIVGLNPKIPGTRMANSWDEMRNCYRTHRLYLNTTIQPYESGYSLSMLEAMATGMPVVSLGSADSPIVDGVNGFVSNDLDYLREKVVQLLSDHALALEMGQAARQTVLKEFTVERFVREWNEALYAVVDAKAAAAA